MIKRYKRTHSGWMRRTSRIYIPDLNDVKVTQIKEFLQMYNRGVDYSVHKLWSDNSEDKFSSKLPDKSFTDRISERFNITKRLAQCVAKQSKEIVKSQSELSPRHQRMPRFQAHLANLDSRFVSIEEFDGHFEMCIKTSSGVPKLVIPFNWTKHSNKFRNDNWTLSKSIRLGYDINGVFVDIILEKIKPPPRTKGKIIGIDRGFNTMLYASDKQQIGGKEFKERIKRGGKRRKSFHHYVETETNRLLKTLNLDGVKTIVLENLKNVKSNKRGKFPRNTNRLLSFWHYAKVGNRLKQLCEELGIRIELKSPWKTSQRCSDCGNIDRRNRRGEKFLCLKCGFAANADYNASRNLEQLGLAGVYSLRLLKKDICLQIS